MDREPSGRILFLNRPPGSSIRTYCSGSFYNMVIKNLDVFQRTLQILHKRMELGTTLEEVLHNALPGFTIQMQDLFRLFIEVTSRGGLYKAAEDGRLDEVVALIPETKDANSLKHIYETLLFQYEHLHFPGSKPAPAPAPSAEVELDHGIAIQEENVDPSAEVELDQGIARQEEYVHNLVEPTQEDVGVS